MYVQTVIAKYKTTLSVWGILMLKGLWWNIIIAYNNLPRPKPIYMYVLYIFCEHCYGLLIVPISYPSCLLLRMLWYVENPRGRLYLEQVMIIAVYIRLHLFVKALHACTVQRKQKTLAYQYQMLASSLYWCLLVDSILVQFITTGLWPVIGNCVTVFGPEWTMYIYTCIFKI